MVGDKSVVLRQTQAVAIYLRLTVPFGCPPNQTLCSLDINTFMPRSKHCEMADVGIQQHTDNPCGVRIHNNEIGKLKPLNLQATLVPRTAPQRRLMTAMLFTQKTYIAHPIFQDYHIGSLTVCICYFS